MFNLSKYSQLPTGDISGGLARAVDDVGDAFEGQTSDNIDEVALDKAIDSSSEEQKAVLEQQKNLDTWNSFTEILKNEYPHLLQATMAPVPVQRLKQIFNTQNISALQGELDQMELGGMAVLVDQVNDPTAQIRPYLQRLDRTFQQSQQNQSAFPAAQGIPGRAAFNLKKHKTAQVSPLGTDFSGQGSMHEQYLENLLAYDGEKGANDSRSEQARQQILMMVSPAAMEEAESAIERIQSLSPTQMEEAIQLMRYLQETWIAPLASDAAEQEQQEDLGAPQELAPEQMVMSKKNPKGIIKFNLSDHVLNNKQASMTKTAADHFGQEYVLYGPSEKRICPKLRGKGGGQPGSGDVVSEFICRHHCLDGIVIDDNKTICGEALWRANVMDKFSREYVDADGNTVGGYINKRFEVNRNVPEENKMRLKPGETRKPRPAEWGNTESRLQAMRKAEGKDRDYRPACNTGDTFNWARDVDQNNVEQDQSTRDSRETAMGHETVQYTNKDKQENTNQKIAGFNMKSFNKTGKRDQIAKEILTKHTCDCGDENCDCGDDCKCESKGKPCCASTKEAQGAGIPVPNDGKINNPVSEEVHVPQPSIWRKLVNRGKAGVKGRQEQMSNALNSMTGDEDDRVPVTERSGSFNLKQHKIASEESKKKS